MGTTVRCFCCMRYSHFMYSCFPSHWRLYSFSHKPCCLLPSMHNYKIVLVEIIRIFYTLLFILHQPRELVFLQWNLFYKKNKTPKSWKVSTVGFWCKSIIQNNYGNGNSNSNNNNNNNNNNKQNETLWAGTRNFKYIFELVGIAQDSIACKGSYWRDLVVWIYLAFHVYILYCQYSANQGLCLMYPELPTAAARSTGICVPLTAESKLPVLFNRRKFATFI